VGPQNNAAVPTRGGPDTRWVVSEATHESMALVTGHNHRSELRENSKKETTGGVLAQPQFCRP